jgi:hypothetical protein
MMRANMRDRFAALALQGMIASSPMCDRTAVDKDVWAKVAYEFSDAMLKARSAPKRRRSKADRGTAK